LERDEYDKIRRVFISAQTGTGLNLLREAVTEYTKASTMARLDRLPIPQQHDART